MAQSRPSQNARLRFSRTTPQPEVNNAARERCSIHHNQGAGRTHLDSLQLGEVADSVCVLGWNTSRWRCPRYVCEIEELQHHGVSIPIHLCGITIGKRWQLEAALNQLQNRCVVRGRVRYVVLPGERGNHEERNPKPGKLEIANVAGVARANVSGL